VFSVTHTEINAFLFDAYQVDARNIRSNERIHGSNAGQVRKTHEYILINRSIRSINSMA
jgi:hypothetical protein